MLEIWSEIAEPVEATTKIVKDADVAIEEVAASTDFERGGKTKCVAPAGGGKRTASKQVAAGKT